MTHDDPLEQLSRALAITPSPEFAARVRQQISTQQARANWWSIRHLAAAAAAVCVVSVVVARWSGQSAAVPVVPVAPGVTAAPAPAAVTPVVTAAARPRRSSPRVVPVDSVFAETLVPDDQRLALERLLGAIRAGRATVPGVVAEETVDEDGRRMPRALVIEPLKLELLAGTPVEPNKDPIKESVK
jgi:hypothetical protein